jgi:two-component system LytT family response regulator
MRVLVVDDERRARERLRRMLTEMPGVELAGEAIDGVSALDAIARLQPDAVFLDVQMPGLTGFDVLSTLPPVGRPLVVFVTAHDHYAFRAFDVSAVDYLVKPVTHERVARALERLRDRDAQTRLTRLVAHLEQARPIERIVGKQQQQFHVLPIDTIEVFVADHDVVCAITSAGRFMVEKSLRDLEAVLDRARFARVHKQAILNLGKLSVVEPIVRGGAVARLHSGRTVNISRRYAAALRHKLGW